MCGCDGATFVRATVEGPPGLSALYLDLAFGSRSVMHQPIARNGAVPSLPTMVGVKLPDVAGTLAITVTGETSTGSLLTASSDVVVRPHQQRDVTLTLAAGIADLATAPSDLAGADFSTANPDLPATPVDLASTDLAGGDICHQTGGATACALGGYLLCDGFEGDSGSTFTGWTNATSANGTLEAVSTPVCRGNTALKAHAVGGSQHAHVDRNLAFGAAAYLRTFLYIPSTTDWTTLSYANAYELGDRAGGGTVNVRYGGSPGKIYIQRSFAANRPEVGSLPRDRWICVEMYVAFSTTNGRITLWIDETQVDDISGTPTLNPVGSASPTFLAVGENGTLASGTLTADVFYDEVVLSGVRIGCH